MNAPEKQKQVTIKPGDQDFPRIMFFNRFRVDRDPDGVLVQFGLLVSSELAACYSCMLPTETLARSKKPLLDYLNRFGLPQKPDPLSWKGLPAERSADMADIVGMANDGHIAETCLFAFSIYNASHAGRGAASEGVVTAQPLILLRSTLEVQKQLIKALYAD